MTLLLLEKYCQNVVLTRMHLQGNGWNIIQLLRYATSTMFLFLHITKNIDLFYIWVSFLFY